MFDELFEIVKDFLRRLVHSRIFALSVIFTLMFGSLIGKLFHLQIIEGEQYQEAYMQKTEKNVTTPGARGNIYDCNGNLLAYNELAYTVVIQDKGDYPKAADRNAMIYRLVTILDRRGISLCHHPACPMREVRKNLRGNAFLHCLMRL